MTKPRLVKVRALLYVFQHVIKKRLAYFDTASSFYEKTSEAFIRFPRNTTLTTTLKRYL